MARGDKADLFFRKLRTAGLTKPAVETLAERLDALEAADSAASGALEPFYVNMRTDAVLVDAQLSLPSGGTASIRYATHVPALFAAGQGIHVSYEGTGPPVTFQAILSVANADGTQLLVVTNGSDLITPGLETTLALTTPVASVGTDLSYDAGTKKVVTAAGGVYMATLEVSVF